MDYIFPRKIQIFKKKNKETKISTTALNNGEPWDLNVSFFLKIEKFQGHVHHRPLKIPQNCSAEL